MNTIEIILRHQAATMLFFRGHFINTLITYTDSCFNCRFQELELLERCEKIRIREATEQEICKLHNKQLFDNLKKISKMKDKRAYEAMASRYDSIYFNEVFMLLYTVKITNRLCFRIPSKQLVNLQVL